MNQFFILSFVIVLLLLVICILLIYYEAQRKTFQNDTKKSISDMECRIDTLKNDFMQKMESSYSSLNAGILEQTSFISEFKDDINNQYKTILETGEELNDNIEDSVEELSKRIELILHSVKELKEIQEKNSIQHAYAMMAGLEEVSQREDVIADIETRNTLINSYNNGKLIKSIIVNSNNTTIFEAEYDSNGEIQTSISYDDKGHKKIQQDYLNGETIKRKTFYGDNVDEKSF